MSVPVGVNTEVLPNAVGTVAPPRHCLLPSINSDVRFLFDIAMPWSYPGGDDPYTRAAAAAPANGAVIRDISEHANGSFVLSSGSGPAINGGGFDFSAVTVAANNAYVAAPVAVAADLYASQLAAGSPGWLQFGFFHIPAAADWFTGAGTGNIMEIGAYNGTDDLSSVAIVNQFTGLRHHQKNGSGSTMSIAGDAPPSYNAIALIAHYHDATGSRLVCRTAAGTMQTTNQVNAGAQGNFSTKVPKWGMASFWDSSITGASNARKLRLMSGGVVNLHRGPRTAAQVLTRLWDKEVLHAYGAVIAGRWS